MNKFHKSILPLFGAGTRKDVVAFYKIVGTHTSAVMHRDAGTYTTTSAPIKVRARLSVCAVVAVLCLLFTNCLDSMDSMFSDYNANFEKAELEIDELLPGDENFQESSMLLEKYPVANDASLTIVSPKADDFHWELYKIVKTVKDIAGYSAVNIEKVPVNLNGYVPVNNQSLSFYLPDVIEINDGTYELRLEVRAKGKTYRDAAMVIVYDPFYDYF